MTIYIEILLLSSHKSKESYSDITDFCAHIFRNNNFRGERNISMHESYTDVNYLHNADQQELESQTKKMDNAG